MVSHSVVSDSLGPVGLYPARLLCPWDFSGKTTGVGCQFLTGDLPDPGIKPTYLVPPALQEDSLHAEPSGKPPEEVKHL